MTESNQPLNLLIVIASIRPGRVGLPVGQWIASVAADHPGFTVAVADLKELDLPLMDEPNHPRLRQYTHAHTNRWSALVDAQDAFVFVMPEYNYAMTAPLKNAIDYLSQEWAYKPVGIVSYGGISGGLRAAQQVKQVVTTLKMMPLFEAVVLPWVSKRIDDDGAFVPAESDTGAAETMLTALWRWAVALKPLRTGEIPAAPPVGEPVAAGAR
jgi:NAD(P)H-dependent FMN reductase